MWATGGPPTAPNWLGRCSPMPYWPSRPSEHCRTRGSNDDPHADRTPAHVRALPGACDHPR
uniref:Uncharacterized protein n=1 Tax=uncultured marine virus TaxID=186617 RepID=A0A0F7L3F8_9VIRU|nr:hypothetical protein [uncultured marine virus]